ncbi:uncharacterized protein [Centruroides vittatus]|uniref:uncharacterized protein n=1 Tax=Centruroides vittatus TaxID=120091 RepID=UPI00350F273A
MIAETTATKKETAKIVAVTNELSNFGLGCDSTESVLIFNLALNSETIKPETSVQNEVYTSNTTQFVDYDSTTQGLLNDTLDGAITVRKEEIVIVTIVLIMWMAVIFLFFSKWGKIRMLEPHQPQYRSQSFSNAGQKSARMSIMEQLTWSVIDRDLPSLGPYDRPRQNSVFVGHSCGRPFSDATRVPRKVKSAEDLTTLVLQIARRNTRSAILSFGQPSLTRPEFNVAEE